MNPVDQVVSLFKSGAKTSEFWIIVVAGVFNAVMAVWDPTKGWQDQAGAIAFAVGGAIYGMSRSTVKTKRLDVIAMMSGMINAAASSVTEDATDPVPPSDQGDVGGNVDENGDPLMDKS